MVQPTQGKPKGGSHLRGNPPKGGHYPPWGIGQPGGVAPGVSQFTSVNFTGKGREAGVLGLRTDGGESINMDCEGRSVLLSLHSPNQDLPLRRPRLRALEE